MVLTRGIIMNVLTVLLLLASLSLAQCSLIRQNIFYSIQDAIGRLLGKIRFRTDPDWGLNIEEVSHKYGYNIDTHKVTTEDGYILKFHHLTHGSKNLSDSKRPVVFLMHPLAYSSRIWVSMGPKSLGYALDRAGYDVWMGNARGTRYGRSHVKLDPNNNPEFWNFSFDEVGYYDLPAMIDYVLKETKVDKLLYYVGHSQGNSAFFTMGARRPEYNEKIKAAVAAAPIAFITGLRYKILLPFITIFIKLLGFQELFRPGPFVPQFGRLFCSRGPTNICELIYGVGFGLSPLTDPKKFALETNTAPEGFSAKMILHYYQIIKSGKFTRYDYGFFGNMAKYRQHSAPNIDVSKVTAPLALFHAPNDPLVPMRNIDKLQNALPNVQVIYEIKNKYFNHLDFVSADNRDVLFSAPLISYLDSIVHTSVK